MVSCLGCFGVWLSLCRSFLYFNMTGGRNWTCTWGCSHVVANCRTWSLQIMFSNHLASSKFRLVQFCDLFPPVDHATHSKPPGNPNKQSVLRLISVHCWPINTVCFCSKALAQQMTTGLSRYSLRFGSLFIWSTCGFGDAMTAEAGCCWSCQVWEPLISYFGATSMLNWKRCFHTPQSVWMLWLAASCIDESLQSMEVPISISPFLASKFHTWGARYPWFYAQLISNCMTVFLLRFFAPKKTTVMFRHLQQGRNSAEIEDAWPFRHCTERFLDLSSWIRPPKRAGPPWAESIRSKWILAFGKKSCKWIWNNKAVPSLYIYINR